MTVEPDEYLVFDFETSGLSPHHDRIIQVGLCHVIGGDVQQQQEWLVDQDVRIDPEAERRHNINAQQIKSHGIPPHDSLLQLMERIEGVPTIVGHNIHTFDVPFLLAECRRLHVAPPRCDDWIDTAAIYKGMKLGMRKQSSEGHRAYATRVLSRPVRGLRYSVSECVRVLRIPTTGEDLHKAGRDAYLTHLIFAALQQHVRV
jgi:DNA polymerase III epsilon subunit-like protein